MIRRWPSRNSPYNHWLDVCRSLGYKPRIIQTCKCLYNLFILSIPIAFIGLMYTARVSFEFRKTFYCACEELVFQQWTASHSNWRFLNNTINADYSVSEETSELIHRGNRFLIVLPSYFFLVPALRFIQFSQPLSEILFVTSIAFINFSAAMYVGLQLSVRLQLCIQYCCISHIYLKPVITIYTV